MYKDVFVSGIIYNELMNIHVKILAFIISPFQNYIILYTQTPHKLIRLVYKF